MLLWHWSIWRIKYKKAFAYRLNQCFQLSDLSLLHWLSFWFHFFVWNVPYFFGAFHSFFHPIYLSISIPGQFLLPDLVDLQSQLNRSLPYAFYIFRTLSPYLDFVPLAFHHLQFWFYNKRRPQSLTAAALRVSMSFSNFGRYHYNTLLCAVSGDVL